MRASGTCCMTTRGFTMGFVPNTTLDEVVRALAKALAGVTSARDAWVSTDDEGFDLWLLIEPLDLDAERPLYTLIDPLEQRFPATGFTLHILNPRTFATLVPASIVPAHARHLGSRAAR